MVIIYICSILGQKLKWRTLLLIVIGLLNCTLLGLNISRQVLTVMPNPKSPTFFAIVITKIFWRQNVLRRQIAVSTWVGISWSRRTWLVNQKNIWWFIISLLVRYWLEFHPVFKVFATNAIRYRSLDILLWFDKILYPRNL